MSNSAKKAYLVAITETSTYHRWFQATGRQDAIEQASALFNSIGSDDFSLADSSTEAIDIIDTRDTETMEVRS